MDSILHTPIATRKRMLYRTGMRNTAAELEIFLNDLAASAEAGDRLPTVRDLMKRFGLSQVIVQRVFHNLQARGVIDVVPGRGTFFLSSGLGADGTHRSGDAAADSPLPTGRPLSILLLRRSVNVDRGRPFIEKLNRLFAAGGHKVIEVSFSDPVHAKAVLKNLPRFDACLIQSVFLSIPSDMVAMIREKTNVVVFDGVAMIVDGVDSVGTEWGEPLTEAINVLHQRGHRRLCFAATSMPFLATSLGFRRWDYLGRTLPDSVLHTIQLPQLPDEGYVEALVEELSRMKEAGHGLPFTGLVAWGVSDGARFLDLLNRHGLSVPGDLSVILLGRTDLGNEHIGFFEMFGPRADDQVALMFDAVCRRWRNPSLPYRVSFAPVTHRPGESVRIETPAPPSNA